MSTSDFDFGTSATGPQDGSFGTPPPSGGGVPVVIVDDDQAVRSRLAMQLGESAVTARSIDDLRARLNGTPVVVVLGPSISSAMGLADAERLVAEHPEVGALLIAAELTTDLFRQSLRAGIKDVLAAPVDTASLAESVRRIAGGLSAARPAAATPPRSTGEFGRVITVFSTKGGAGKSVMATNLAVVLAKRSEQAGGARRRRPPVRRHRRDAQAGPAAHDRRRRRLARPPRRQPAAEPAHRTTSRACTSWPPRSSPSSPTRSRRPRWCRSSSCSASFAGHVVIDTPAHFNDVVLAMIEMSDEVLLIAGMDIPNIKNVKIGLQTLRLLNTPPEKLHLVLNRANSKVKLDVSEVERTLQIKAEGLIPSDVVVPAVGEQGRPARARRPEVGRGPVDRGSWPTPVRGRSSEAPAQALSSGGKGRRTNVPLQATPRGPGDRAGRRRRRGGATPSSTSCARRSTTT